MTDYSADRAAVARRAELEVVAQAAQRRTAAEAEAERQEAWALERPKLALRHAEWRRHCENTQTPYHDPAPLPLSAPLWFRTDTGEPVEHEAHIAAEVPSAFSESHNAIGQPYAAEAEPTPEMVFAAAEKSGRKLLGGWR